MSATLLADDQSAATAAGPLPYLSATGIEVSYGRVKVLFGVDLTIARGERLALLGTNGAGKSTLLKVIAGLLRPDKGTGGTVVFDGEDVTHLPAESRVTRGMVMVAGGRATFPSLSVDENLRAGAYPFLRRRALVDERVAEVLDLFPVLGQRLKQKAGTLSGGEQQMMALGRALIAGADLLMIDELSLGLAPVVMQEILKMVDEIVRRGTTVILVEQSLNIALSVSERAMFMEKGQVKFAGPAHQLLEQADLVRSVFFGDRRQD